MFVLHYFYPKDDILHSSRILRPLWFDDFDVSEGPESAVSLWEGLFQMHISRLQPGGR